MVTSQLFELSTIERRKRIFSEDFKKLKVQQIERKQTTIAEVSKAYQVRYNNVSRWVEKFGLNHQKDVRLVVEIESETKKLIALQANGIVRYVAHLTIIKTNVIGRQRQHPSHLSK